jgi:glycosyltransferase involved in cell wall biosynthesis
MLNKQIIIDFYGPIDHNDKEYFLENVKIYPNTRYMGVVEQQEVHHVLAEYDIMVLPTKYYTEGFPGSILDAYISGIPVIVTKWKHADEFVDDGKTGFIVPFQYGDVEFIESVLKLYNNYSLLSEMKKLAYEKSKEYGYESAWKKIEPYLNS